MYLDSLKVFAESFTTLELTVVCLFDSFVETHTTMLSSTCVFNC